MIKRSLLGIGLFLIFTVSLYLKIFPLLVLLLAVVGTIEAFIMFKNSKKIFIVIYWIIFMLGMFGIDQLYQKGHALLIIVLLLIIFSDSFAYLVGILIGKHKFSKISPNKTIEGLLGGIIITIILFTIANVLTDNFIFNELGTNKFSIHPSIIMLIIIILGIIGDLLESYTKRISKVKDSSNILGSHGGVLDRTDSWILVSCITMLLF